MACKPRPNQTHVLLGPFPMFVSVGSILLTLIGQRRGSSRGVSGVSGFVPSSKCSSVQGGPSLRCHELVILRALRLNLHLGHDCVFPRKLRPPARSWRSSRLRRGSQGPILFGFLRSSGRSLCNFCARSAACAHAYSPWTAMRHGLRLMLWDGDRTVPSDRESQACRQLLSRRVSRASSSWANEAGQSSSHATSPRHAVRTKARKFLP